MESSRRRRSEGAAALLLAWWHLSNCSNTWWRQAWHCCMWRCRVDRLGEWSDVMRAAAICVCIAIAVVDPSAAWSQQNPVGAAPQQAPIGYRPQSADVPRGERQSRHAPSRAKNTRTGAGDPPTLEVGSSCEAAGRGSVVLGRDKKACLGDETTAQDTLKQNWSKYVGTDKSDCVGMVTTGGPASYVELLSCVEILRDARNIRNADALESDDTAISSRRRRRN
jgi:hypothetical protein